MSDIFQRPSYRVLARVLLSYDVTNWSNSVQLADG